MIHCAIDSGGEARPTVHRTRPGDPAVTIFIRSINSSGLLRYSAAVWNVNKATPMAMYAQTFHKSQRPEMPKINPPATIPKTATIATTFRTRFFMIGPPSALGSMGERAQAWARQGGYARVPQWGQAKFSQPASGRSADPRSQPTNGE